MAERRGSKHNTSFDFYSYIEEVHRQQERLRDVARSEDELATRLGQLVVKADSFLAEKRMLSREVVLEDEGLDNCLLAFRKNEDVVLQPIEMEEGEQELFATYQGLYLHKEQFGIAGLASSRLYIAHRLVVDLESFHHLLFTSYFEQSALLPIEDTHHLQIVES